MDQALALPTVTIPRAAYAAGFSTRALRAIMAPPRRLALLGQPDRAARRRNQCAPVDVVRLAVAKRLLDYGFTVPEANEILDRTVDRHLFALTACGADLPSRFICNGLANATLNAARHSEGIAAWAGARCGVPHDTVLTIDLGAVAREALNRLSATLNSAGRPATESA